MFVVGSRARMLPPSYHEVLLYLRLRRGVCVLKVIKLLNYSNLLYYIDGLCCLVFN